MARTARVYRQTAETEVDLDLTLDTPGKADVDTGVGFFDHMLTLLAKHAAVDLSVKASGDLQVDQHHTVEDVGICLGQVFAEALGDKAGIRRYGHFALPMEEALITSVVDLGRVYIANTNLAISSYQLEASLVSATLRFQKDIGKDGHRVALFDDGLEAGESTV